MTALAAFGRWVLSWLTKGALDRAIDIVDKRLDNEAAQQRVKANVIEAHLKHRAAFMQSGGFWLMLIFAGPLAFWWSAVIIYSVLWCADCAYPKEWTIAALPSPLDEWSGAIIVAIFGVVGITRFVKK